MTEQKPSLSDQHWRVSLRKSGPQELDAAMIDAITDGNRWRFDILMQLPQFWSEQQTAIAACVQNGRVDMLRALIEKNPKWQDRISLDACLETAIEQDHLPMFKYLAEERGVPVKSENENMLAKAAEAGRMDFVEYLLAAGCDAAANDSHALVLAAEEGHLDIVKKLQAAGGNIRADEDAAVKAALRYNKRAVAVWLLQQGCDPGDYAPDAFVQACKMGEATIAKLLIDSGVDIGPYEINTALLGALQNGCQDAALLCLGLGGDINAENGDALRHAVSVNDHDTVRFIAAHGGDMNAVHKGNTILMTAASRGHLDGVMLLIDLGADVTRMNFGVIRVAADRGYSDISRAIARHVRDKRRQLQTDMRTAFGALMGSNYTIDDLRHKKTATGQTGMEVAAQTGQFGKLLLAAKGGFLAPEDLFLPDDKVDSVLSHLIEHKSVAQFFEPALWTGRQADAERAIELLPEGLRARAPVEALAASFRQQQIKKGSQNRKPGL